MRELTKSAGMIFLFLILAALYFYDVLSGEYLLTERDLGAFFIPPRLFWVDAVRHSSFPFWNPYYHSGHPLFATLQPGVFYPFSLLYLFLPFPLVFNNTIVLHFALAGIFTYLLMRAQNASHGASFIAGFCFVFGGYFMSVHSLLSTLLSVTWVPLFLLAYFSAFYKNTDPSTSSLDTFQHESERISAREEKPDSRLNITRSIWAGVVGMVMFLGGGVEVCFLIFSLVFLLSLFPGLLFEKTQYAPIKTRFFCFTIFALTFAGLSAVQLFPFWELSHLSVRSTGLSYDEATTWSLSPADLITFFVPDLYGYGLVDAPTAPEPTGSADHPTPESQLLSAWGKYWGNQNWLKSIYLGGIPFLLALLFFLKRERKPQGFILLILLSLVLAFGKHSSLYLFFYDQVPFINQLRYPVKFIFLAIFLISLSAGFGYDRFVRRAVPLRLAKMIFGVGFVSVALFGILNAYEDSIISLCKSAGWDWPAYNEIYVNLHNTKRFLCFTGLFSLTVYLGGKVESGATTADSGVARESPDRVEIPSRWKKFSGYMVVFILILDLFFSNQGFYVKIKTREYLESGSNMSFILSDPSLFRIFVTKKTRDAKSALIAPGQSGNNVQNEKINAGLGRIKIFDTGLTEVTLQSRYKDIVSLINMSSAPDSTNLLDMLNVKYLISIPPVKSPNYRLAHMNIPGDPGELEKEKTIKVYENLKVLPRAFFVDTCRELHSEQEYKDTLSSREFHADEVVLLDKSPEGFPCDKSLPSEGSGEFVDITDYQNNSIELKIKSNTKKLLFLSESYFPGWEALVDGKPTAIYRANYVFRALLLEPGVHHIRFRYNPVSFKIGAVITVATMLICAIVLARKKV